MPINQQVSWTKLENGHFYWGLNRVKIFLLFLTLETQDFESDPVFEIHEYLQSTAHMMPVLTCFNMDQIGPNLGQIWTKSGPNSQFLKQRPETLAYCTFLRIQACIYLLRICTIPRHDHKWDYFSQFSDEYFLLFQLQNHMTSRLHI